MTAKKIHHQEISGRYKDDAKILEIKSKYENILEEQLRSKGYVPVLNINPQWHTSWDREAQVYEFVMVMYGVYVGKNKAKTTVGWDSELGKMYD